jgi:hypothetical protein
MILVADEEDHGGLYVAKGFYQWSVTHWGCNTVIPESGIPGSPSIFFPVFQYPCSYKIPISVLIRKSSCLLYLFIQLIKWTKGTG